jgi:hypothetical protein
MGLWVRLQQRASKVLLPVRIGHGVGRVPQRPAVRNCAGIPWWECQIGAAFLCILNASSAADCPHRCITLLRRTQTFHSRTYRVIEWTSACLSTCDTSILRVIASPVLLLVVGAFLVFSGGLACSIRLMHAPLLFSHCVPLLPFCMLRFRRCA